VREAERLDGKWVLVTNTLTVEDIADAYHSQIIERGFRTLKTGQIEVGPMHHRLATRIEANRFFRVDEVPDEVSAMLATLKIEPPKPVMDILPRD
jgi:hypothetical protein